MFTSSRFFSTIYKQTNTAYGLAPGKTTKGSHNFGKGTKNKRNENTRQGQNPLYGSLL